MPNLRIRKRTRIHQMLQKHRMRKRTQSRSPSRARNRQRPSQRLHHPPQNIPAASAQPPLPRPQTRMRLRMPHRKKFKFQRQQNQPPVLCNLRIMLAQSPQKLLRIVVPLQQLVHLRDLLRHPLLQQRKENIFLAVKVRVESPPRIPGPRRNILQPRRLIPIARKSLLRRQQKFPPRSRRPRRLPRRHRRRRHNRDRLPARRPGNRRTAHALPSLTFIFVGGGFSHDINSTTSSGFSRCSTYLVPTIRTNTLLLWLLSNHHATNIALQDTYMHVYNKSSARASQGASWPLPP